MSLINFKILLINVMCINFLLGQSAVVDDGMKIVGGAHSVNNYNYMVSLQVYVTDNSENSLWPSFINLFHPSSTPPPPKKKWRHYCGGSIIDSRNVVTAAHCVDRVPPGIMSVVVGTNDLKSGNGTRYLVKDYTMHEDYVELEKNDIALMHLKEEIKFTNLVQPIETSQKFVGGNEELLLVGWGFTLPPRVGDTPTHLREAKFRSMTNKDCESRGMQPGDSEICMYEGIFKGACGGDSGGPLVKSGTRTLVGIVSYGTVICAIGFPDVYTRASVFYTWLQENSI